MTNETPKKRNVTISLSPESVRKAKILAAKRSTSISRLLAEEIERLVGAEEAYERSLLLSGLRKRLVSTFGTR